MMINHRNDSYDDSMISMMIVRLTNHDIEYLFSFKNYLFQTDWWGLCAQLDSTVPT